MHLALRAQSGSRLKSRPVQVSGLRISRSAFGAPCLGPFRPRKCTAWFSHTGPIVDTYAGGSPTPFCLLLSRRRPSNPGVTGIELAQHVARGPEKGPRIWRNVQRAYEGQLPRCYAKNNMEPSKGPVTPRSVNMRLCGLPCYYVALRTPPKG